MSGADGRCWCSRSFGTAALTYDTLQGPEALRRGQSLADVIEVQLRAVRSDDHVADDALLLVMEIATGRRVPGRGRDRGPRV